jgi:hypothetical protein
LTPKYSRCCMSLPPRTTWSAPILLRTVSVGSVASAICNCQDEALSRRWRPGDRAHLDLAPLLVGRDGDTGVHQPPELLVHALLLDAAFTLDQGRS